MTAQPLTYAHLREAVAGAVVAIRRTSVLKPVGGDSDKVFPPTYQDGPYAFEERLVREPDGSLRTVRTVLLDSVQSQANRMELALLRGWRQAKLKFPVLLVDFAEGETDAMLREIGQITALEAPHRIADAILRDSQLDGVEFRKSPAGRGLEKAASANATPLFATCPTALVFGVWDSTGPKGGAGAKFSRVIASEIIGFAALEGQRPTGRIDPLQIENIEQLGTPIYRTKDNSWSFDKAEAALNKGKPITLKPSQIVHGNITPSLKDEGGVPHHGGVNISHAAQSTVISLAGLRRLRFPVDDRHTDEIDVAARTTLAALALAAVCWQQEDGYDLRSRCWLDGPPVPFEFVGQGEARPFTLSAAQSAVLLEEAAAEAVRQGLPWPLEPKKLTPSEKLKQLIRKSREKTMAVSVD